MLKMTVLQLCLSYLELDCHFQHFRNFCNWSKKIDRSKKKLLQLCLSYLELKFLQLNACVVAKGEHFYYSQ